MEKWTFRRKNYTKRLEQRFAQCVQQRDEETSNQDRYIAEFTSDSGGWYTVRVVDIGSEQEVGIDNELTRYYELEFDGNHAIWGIREDNSNVLVWEADGLSFTIYGNPNISELIKVAEGITVDSTLK